MAFCEGEVFRINERNCDPLIYTYVVKYEPLTELNKYMVDQYFLNKSEQLFNSLNQRAFCGEL